MSFAKKTAILFKKYQHKNLRLLMPKRYKSWWCKVEKDPPDAIFGVIEAYHADKNTKKINVAPGVYKDHEGEHYVLPCLRKAEEKIFNKTMNHEYAPIDGLPEFRKVAAELAFGKDSCVIKNGLHATLQTVGGSGALRLAAAFFLKFYPGCKVIYIPKPTWIWHEKMFHGAGMKTKFYTYYDPKNMGFDFCAMRDDISKLPDKSIVLFHAVNHNPTGVDPTVEQWKEISEICKEKKFMVFFDMAYLGFASGDIEKDICTLRFFVEEGHKILLTQTFSKSMGLYGQRIGALSIVTSSKDETARLVSQLKTLTRTMFSNPPIHGARFVTEVLSNNILRCQWKRDVKAMTERINGVRRCLVEHLTKLGSCRNWDHITQQTGMFANTGLTANQVERMKKEFSCYTTSDGRIAVAGLADKHVKYLANAMHTVTK